MLVLSRKAGERITIGEDIVLVVNRISPNRVSLGIEAPDSHRIVRGELARIIREFELDAPLAEPVAEEV